MTCKIANVRGGAKKDVLSKKFNILIGISLGNKFFTENNLEEYILWALENTKKRVLIWIADKIHAVNYEVKNKQSRENSLKRAFKEGDRFFRVINEITERLPEERRKLVKIVRKGDLENSEEYKKRRSFFYKKFKEDRQFRKEVFNIVRSTISLDFHEFEIEKLSEYVLDELPIVLCSFIYDKTEYSCHPYPVNTKISEFAEKIQNKEIFPEISVELKFKNMVCVQLVIV